MQLFTVEGMTCGHCVKAVTRAIQTLDPDARVEVDLAQRQVRVQSTQPDAALVAALQEEGYSAAAA